MVDNKIKIIFKMNQYALAQFVHPTGKIANKFVYSSGEDLESGDKAEILGPVLGIDFLDFITKALAKNDFTREYYWFTFGYQPADFDKLEIKNNEVRIHYAGIDNTITQKEFYDLCLLLCNAKLKILDWDLDSNINEIELLKLKSELKEKINHTYYIKPHNFLESQKLTEKTTIKKEGYYISEAFKWEDWHASHKFEGQDYKVLIFLDDNIVVRDSVTDHRSFNMKKCIEKSYKNDTYSIIENIIEVIIEPNSEFSKKREFKRI